MEYLKLQVRDFGIDWVRASKDMRGTLITILHRCAILENNGVIIDCRHWDDPDWQRLFDVTANDVLDLVAYRLAEWKACDLWLAMYDRVGQQRLETQRAQGHHGAKGWKNPKGNPKGAPKGTLRGAPHIPTQVGREASPKGSTLYAPLGLVAQGAESPEKYPMNLKAQMGKTK